MKLKLDGRSGYMKYTVLGREKIISGRLGYLANVYAEAVIAGVTTEPAWIRKSHGAWQTYAPTLEECEAAFAASPLLRGRLKRLRARRERNST